MIGEGRRSDRDRHSDQQRLLAGVSPDTGTRPGLAARPRRLRRPRSPGLPRAGRRIRNSRRGQDDPDGFSSDAAAQTFGDIGEGVSPDIQREQRELLTPVTGDDVTGTGHDQQSPSHLRQHLITSRMAESVVHRLEVVDVNEDQPHSGSGASYPTGRQPHLGLQIAAGTQAGQPVRDRQTPLVGLQARHPNDDQNHHDRTYGHGDQQIP